MMEDGAFLAALARTLRREGVNLVGMGGLIPGLRGALRLSNKDSGWVNDPQDPGGETKFGISKRAYPDLDITSLTLNQAAEIYYRDYWKEPGFNRINDSELAARLFDLGVNCGTGNAVKLLQAALVLLGFKTVVDGKLGPQTRAYANACPHPAALVMAVKYLAADRYVRLGKPRFLAGWLGRLDS